MGTKFTVFKSAERLRTMTTQGYCGLMTHPGQRVGCETSKVVRGSTVSEECAFGGMERDQNLFLPSALAGGPQLAKAISVDHQATVNLELPGATSKNIKSRLI